MYYSFGDCKHVYSHESDQSEAFVCHHDKDAKIDNGIFLRANYIPYLDADELEYLQ